MSHGRPPIAFLDASVLFPALLRNILMHLGLAGLFRLRWSDQVHEEWIAALLRLRPDLSRERLMRVRHLMEAHALDARVAGFEHRIERLTLPDPEDRHVLAAAIEAGADVIVTANLRDFPPEVMSGHGILAQHPDTVLVERFAENPGAVLSALRTLRGDLRNPARTAQDLLTLMERQTLVETAAALRPFVDAF